MKNNYLIILIIALTGLISCKDQINEPSDDDLPEKNVSYNLHIQPIFNIRCATAGCHDDVTRAANLSLTSYHNATAGYTFVFPGNPDASPLILAIEGKSPYPMPPPGRPPLTQKQIKAIRTWVAEGAKNN